jgi:hypothetical protein
MVVLFWEVVETLGGRTKLEEVSQCVSSMVQSVIRRLSNSFCPTGKSPWQDAWVKIEFIKSQGEIQKREWWPRWNLEARRM